MTACFGDNSVRVPPDGSKGFGGLGIRKGNCAILADSFATVSLSAQLGTFQKMFLDLTRFQALFDFPSSSTFVSGAARLAKDVYNSREYNMEAIQKICPNTSLSFQQQVPYPYPFILLFNSRPNVTKHLFQTISMLRQLFFQKSKLKFGWLKYGYYLDVTKMSGWVHVEHILFS